MIGLDRQIKSIRDELSEEIERVLDEGWFILGKSLKKFEREFAAYCGVKYAIGVGSGTDALLLSLKAFGIGQGNEVLVPANTFIATAEAVTHTGATPIFADVNSRTCNIDVKNAGITEKTKAIIPVHLYGQPADMNEISNFAERHGLLVIEDACQAHGATYKGKKVGSLGDSGCFSFYPTKPLGALGDGGAVTTNDEEVAHKVRLLRNHGRVERHFHATPGYTSRLDEIQAAVLLTKLKYLDEWNDRRAKIAEKYNDLLSDLNGLETPYCIPQAKHVYHLYVVKVVNRDTVRVKLREIEIETGIHYPTPIHLQPAYINRHISHKKLANVEELAGKVLSLPMFAELTNEEVEYVAKSISEHSC